jgi:thiamine pyrophosphate-dependent acetolactate synthase large subunit-like protein
MIEDGNSNNPGADAQDAGFNRRAFLKGSAAGMAAGVALAGAAKAVAAEPAGAAKAPAEPRSEAAAGEANLQGDRFVPRPGSDFMVDVLKSLGIPYVTSNPASSLRSLHESVVNYGGNKAPEFITCLHEESAAAMAHGYAKASGQPLAVMAHGTVGLQHASMAVYNAFCDRVPLLVMAGNATDAVKRRPGVEWYHCMQDPGSVMRDFTKFDDQPASLQHFAESTVRAMRMAMTPPMAPVLIACDMELQEEPAGTEKLTIPSFKLATPPQADASALAEAAKMLAAAQNPLIIADRAARSQEGVAALVLLAEALQAPVISTGNRMNFPGAHYLEQSERRGALVAGADVILMLEVADAWGMLGNLHDPWKTEQRIARADVKVIHITLTDFVMKSNYQDMQRFQAVALPIAGDAQASLAPLTEAVKREISSTRAAAIAQKADGLKKQHAQMHAQQQQAAAIGWDASPVSTARLAGELYGAIRHEKWSLVATEPLNWPKRLWPTTDYYQMLGASGGYGVGYTAPAAVGAALANRDRGILSVVIQPDGDLLYAPGVLWTAAHHRIPILFLMYNNGGYVQEIMHLQRMAGMHQRDPRTAKVGTMLYDPAVQFAKLAESFGVWAEGPISDPAKIGPALQRALKVVKGGAPALVDVVCQLR